MGGKSCKPAMLWKSEVKDKDIRKVMKQFEHERCENCYPTEGKWPGLIFYVPHINPTIEKSALLTRRTSDPNLNKPNHASMKDSIEYLEAPTQAN